MLHLVVPPRARISVTSPLTVSAIHPSILAFAFVRVCVSSPLLSPSSPPPPLFWRHAPEGGSGPQRLRRRARRRTGSEPNPTEQREEGTRSQARQAGRRGRAPCHPNGPDELAATESAHRDAHTRPLLCLLLNAQARPLLPSAFGRSMCRKSSSFRFDNNSLDEWLSGALAVRPVRR